MNRTRVTTPSARLALVFLLGLLLAFVVGRVHALSPFPLVDTVWSWHSTDAGIESVRVAAPERYTFRLLGDGTVRVRADCNRGGGRYEANDVELKFSPIATTKKGCPAGSRGGEFLDALSKVGGYRFEGTDLLLTQASGSAMLRFRPAER